MGMFLCENCGENRSDAELAFHALHGWPSDQPEGLPCWECDPDSKEALKAIGKRAAELAKHHENAWTEQRFIQASGYARRLFQVTEQARRLFYHKKD